MKKTRVAILFGGRSAEHEVSLQSAKNVVSAIDREKYDVVLIGIDKKGKWLLEDRNRFLLHANNPKEIQLEKSDNAVAIIPDESTNELVSLSNREEVGRIDVVIPMLHGSFGEDGTIQGLLKLANIPFVGASVLGSAIGMDKDVMKRLLRDAGIPIGKFLVFEKYSLRPRQTRLTQAQTKKIFPERAERVEGHPIDFEEIVRHLGIPFFIKPANLGSSIGITKVHDESEFKGAIELAFSYDKKILIEEFIKGKEIFCSVLGNEEIIASVPGELKTSHEFYDYDAKYVDEIEMKIPAPLPEEIKREIQQLAIKVAKVLCCEGMARVDFFVTDDNNVYLNEINTIPGFTEHSWYPKLWEASGISPTELIDRLIQLAIERFSQEKQLKTTYTE